MLETFLQNKECLKAAASPENLNMNENPKEQLRAARWAAHLPQLLYPSTFHVLLGLITYKWRRGTRGST